MIKSSNWQRDDGFALLSVLAFLLLAAAIVTPFLSSAANYAALNRNAVRETRQRFALEGILALAAQSYFEWSSRGDRLPLQVECLSKPGGADLLIGFQNHAGLIDLNAAPASLLEDGFRAVAIETHDASELAAAADSYRLADQTVADPRFTGMIAGGAKNGPFEHVAELLDFAPLSGVKSETLDGVFTVLTDAADISPDFLPPGLAPFIRLSDPDRDAGTVSTTARAFSVTVMVRVGSTPTKQASAAFSVQDARRVFRFGPVGFNLREMGATPPPPEQIIPCGRFFDEGAQHVLEELGL